MIETSPFTNTLKPVNATSGVGHSWCRPALCKASAGDQILQLIVKIFAKSVSESHGELSNNLLGR